MNGAENGVDRVDAEGVVRNAVVDFVQAVVEGFEQFVAFLEKGLPDIVGRAHVRLMQP